MQDKEYLGKLISEARKNKGITQQELALKLNISDKAISNWETGKNIPDLSMLRRIEKVLDIELLDKIEYKKSQKVIKVLIVVLIFIAFILLIFGTYFVNNFNKFNIYEITIADSKYILDDSTLIVTNDEVILNLGSITNREDPKELNYTVTIYYQNNQTTKELISKHNYHYLTLKDSKIRKELLNNINNLYIKIAYQNYYNEEVIENIKLNLTKTYSNNKLIYQNDNKENDNIDQNLITLLKNNNYHETEKNIYVKQNGMDNLKIDVSKNLIYYEGEISGHKVYAVTDYVPLNRQYKYLVYENGEIIENTTKIEFYKEFVYYNDIRNVVEPEIEKLLYN